MSIKITPDHFSRTAVVNRRCPKSRGISKASGDNITWHRLRKSPDLSP